ncbi:MAG: gamma-glutamyl-gamma-aminobutyrate hydrolase family protein [Thermocrispum sp.]
MSSANGSAHQRRSVRPVLGICARTAPVTLQGTDMTVTLAFQPHVNILAAAGCTPVLIPLLPGVEHIIGQLDGLLVPGGPDVDPALYGDTTHPKTRAFSPVMDAAELELVKAAFSAGLPILAICRGMQLLNVLCGGSLHQHLPELIGHDGHQPDTGEFTLGSQRIELKPGSRIEGILGDDVPEAPCHHHQAINQIGTGLIATAWAPDGVVEVVEAADHPFAIGVQWEAGHTEDERLHRALAAAAASRAPRRITTITMNPVPFPDTSS